VTRYDDLFDETAPNESVFGDKRALVPLTESEKAFAHDEQKRTLSRLLNGIYEGYLPTTLSVYRPRARARRSRCGGSPRRLQIGTTRLRSST
jgi:hypothetical protein